MTHVLVSFDIDPSAFESADDLAAAVAATLHEVNDDEGGVAVPVNVQVGVVVL